MRLEKFLFKKANGETFDSFHPMYTYARGLLTLATGNCATFGKCRNPIHFLGHFKHAICG